MRTRLHRLQRRLSLTCTPLLLPSMRRCPLQRKPRRRSASRLLSACSDKMQLRKTSSSALHHCSARCLSALASSLSPLHSRTLQFDFLSSRLPLDEHRAIAWSPHTALSLVLRLRFSIELERDFEAFGV